MTTRKLLPQCCCGLTLAIVLSLCCSSIAQTDTLGDLKGRLDSTDGEQTDAIRSLCDQILTRDVVADFVTEGDDAILAVMYRLLKLHELGSRMESWQEELAKHPDSERLNFLLAMASKVRKESSSDAKVYPNTFLPVRVRLTRKGATFTAEMNAGNRRWEEHVNLDFPRKILVGFCANRTTAKIENVTFTGSRPLLPLPQWKQVQISRESTNGSIDGTEKSFQIHGAGFLLYHGKKADDIFFACQELDGDGSLEATLQGLDSSNPYGMAGLMMRASLDAASPFVAVLSQVEDRGMAFWQRGESSDIERYLTSLSKLRSHDPQFLAACIQEMFLVGMNRQALEVLQQWMKEDPTVTRQYGDLVQNIFVDANGLPLPSPEVKATPSNEGDRMDLAMQFGKQANESQERGEHEKAVEYWHKMRELTPDHMLSLDEQQKLLVSLQKLKLDDELRDGLEEWFLGGAKAASAGRRCEEILSRVTLGETPCLVFDKMSAFYLAAKIGAASGIAQKLDKVTGTTSQKAAAKAIAATLRVSAHDPAVMESLGKNAYLGMLAADISEAGLVLLAWQLEQTNLGRKAAIDVITKALASKQKDFDRNNLLLWRARLCQFEGVTKLADNSLTEIVENCLRDGTVPSEIVFGEVMRYLFGTGELGKAERLAALARSQYGRPVPSEVSETLDLLDLHLGKLKPMPVLWTMPAGEETEIHWEYAPGNWAFTPEREMRATGQPVAVWDHRYTLEIYALDSQYGSDRDLPEDYLIARLPGAASAGTWKGLLPENRYWLVAVLREKDGKFVCDDKGARLVSPRIPAANGENLLGPLRVLDLADKRGNWSMETAAFWGAAPPTSFPNGHQFISRIQPDVGEIVIKHVPITLDPQQSYVFSIWLHQDGIGARIVFLDETGNSVAEWSEWPQIGGSWVHLSYNFGYNKRSGRSSLPSTARTAVILVRVTSQGELGNAALYARKFSTAPPGRSD